MPHNKPYPKGKRSRASISRKIKKLLKEGKSKAQSVAIALSMARKGKHGSKKA